MAATDAIGGEVLTRIPASRRVNKPRATACIRKSACPSTRCASVRLPNDESASVGVFVGVGRDRLRVEVSDGSAQGARPRSPSEEGGYGLALVASLASRWGAGREDGLNLTWFELDLPSPGA